MRGEEAGDSRADEETDPEGDADERERSRTLLGGRDVGDVRLRDREISGGDAVDGASKEDDRQIRRGGGDEEAGEGAELAHEQDRFAAEPIGKRAQRWTRDELAASVRRLQQTDRGGAGPEALRVEGEQRDHDGEAEHVDQHDEEDREERASHAHIERSLWQASSSTPSSLAKQKRRRRSPGGPR